MTNTLTENQAHCKHIADTLEHIADNSVYKCTKCGEHIAWDNEQYEAFKELFECGRS